MCDYVVVLLSCGGLQIDNGPATYPSDLTNCVSFFRGVGFKIYPTTALKLPLGYLG